MTTHKPNKQIQDDRLYFPATERNREVILEVLKKHLPQTGTVFEIASGSGEHTSFFAPHFPTLQFQPSDIETNHLKSIDAWQAFSGHENILPALNFDVIRNSFTDYRAPSRISAIYAANLIHISPWEATVSLVSKAGDILQSNDVFITYGPYKRNGEHTSQSNEAFDASLKARNPEWGIRDIEVITKLAENSGFLPPEIIPMPANNFSLIFKRS